MDVIWQCRRRLCGDSLVHGWVLVEGVPQGMLHTCHQALHDAACSLVLPARLSKHAFVTQPGLGG
jgi:hypothetical protein